MTVLGMSRKANCYGKSGRWYHALRRARIAEVSLQELLRIRHHQATVIAVGGNSIEGLEIPTVRNIVRFRRPVVSHGNGPQVGRLMLKYAGSRTLNECVAETQRSIGGELKVKLREAAQQAGTEVKIDVVPTRVIVDPQDPAFKNPTKYVGQEYSIDEVRRMGGKEVEDGLYYVEANGWHIRQFKGKPGVYRRVVASPKPIAIHPEDLEKIRERARPGYITIAVGGGGVPVYIDQLGVEKPIDAVIDKDLASALLARELEVRELIISTGVERVSHFYGMGDEVEYGVDYMMLQDALVNLHGGVLQRSDLAFFSEGYQIWYALRDRGYLKTDGGRGIIRPSFEAVDAEAFRNDLGPWTDDKVSFRDIDLAYQIMQRAQEGQYPPGSMGEKMEAAINALRGGVNVVLITEPRLNWIGFEGTLLTRGLDLSGRRHNLGRLAGNRLERAIGRRFGLPTNELQRWLVT